MSQLGSPGGGSPVIPRRVQKGFMVEVAVQAGVRRRASHLTGRVIRVGPMLSPVARCGCSSGWSGAPWCPMCVAGGPGCPQPSLCLPCLLPSQPVSYVVGDRACETALFGVLTTRLLNQGGTSLVLSLQCPGGLPHPRPPSLCSRRGLVARTGEDQ